MTAVAESYRQAVELHRAGSLDKAEKLYRQIIRMDSTHSDALHHLGLIEFDRNRHVAAVDLIGQAIDLNADAAPYWISLGKVYHSLGQSDKAIEAFQQAIRRDGSCIEAFIALGMLLRDCSEPNGAEACFRQALLIDPQSADACYELSLLYRSIGKRDDAASALRRAFEIAPASIEKLCALAAGTEQQGKFEDALGLYSAILDARPTEATAMIGVAHVLLSQRRLEESRDWYTKGLDLSPQNAAAWTNLGCIQSVLSKIDEAARCFEQAIAVDSGCVAAHFNLANYHASQGRSELAIAAYGRALECDHQHTGALRNLGNVLISCGRFNEAESNYRQALAIQPNDAGTLINLGHALKEQKRYDEAIECFERSLELIPENAAVLYILGRTLELHGKADESIEKYRRAIELNPTDAQARYHLGNAFKTVGRIDESIESFQEARRLDPGHVPTVYQLGNAFRNQKRFDDARECYEEVLKLRPDDFDTMISLGNVLKSQDDLPGAAARYRTVLDQLPDQPLWRLWVATLCPIVFHGSAGIDDYRKRLLDDLNRLARKNVRIEPRDIVQCGCPPPYGLQFHGRDDRPLKEAYARVFDNCLQPEQLRRRTGKPRVGFVVTSGHEGAFLRYLGPVLERMNRNEFESIIICSAGGKTRIETDPTSPKLPLLVIPSRFDHIVETITEAEFDVLYHWEVGSDVTNYFLPFFKLAPVQCTGAGLPVTSGIAAIDYFISDTLCEPARGEWHYTEELVRFQSTTTMQRRLTLVAPPKTRTDFGFSDRSHLYVCPHKIEKFHPDLDELFRDILRRDREGIVVIPKDREGYAARKLRGRLQLTAPDVFDRIVFVPYQTLHGYLSLTNMADVLLDPLHYGGGLTTFDGFSLNQPIVTMPGKFLRGRFTSGFYTRMGMNDCIADSFESYAETAVRIAGNADLKTQLRETLRERSEVLFDDATAVTEYEQHFMKWIEESRRNPSGN